MITIVTGYPDLMNLYGDYANALLLQKRLLSAGLKAERRAFTAGEEWDPDACELLCIGAGSEQAMLYVLRDLMTRRAALEEYAARGGRVLLTGNALALFAARVTSPDGQAAEGPALLDLAITLTGRRDYAEGLFSTPLAPEHSVIGAINTSLRAAGNAKPLFAADYLTADVGLRGHEGAVAKNICATQLTGPLLARNPALLEVFAAALCGGELPRCDEAWYRAAWQGYNSALETLRRVRQKGGRAL